jgi:hypothetical protein
MTAFHTIAELGGTILEYLPTAESIKKLERAEKKQLTAPKRTVRITRLHEFIL